MKVECRFCHKKFDHELYSGLCPYCGRYDGSSREPDVTPAGDGETESPSDQRTAERETQEGRAAFGRAQRKDDLEKILRESRSRGNKIAVFILLFLLLLPITVSPFLLKHRTKTKQIENMADTTVDVIEDGLLRYDAAGADGDVISYAVSIKTEKIQRDSKHSWRRIPEGYEVIRVPYEIGIFVGDGEVKKISELPEGEIWPSLYNIHMTPYAVTKSGTYLEAVSQYAAGENLGLDYEELEQQGISDGFQLESGALFFLVKKNDFQELLVNSYDYDEDAYQNTKLRGSYQIPCPDMQK